MIKLINLVESFEKVSDLLSNPANNERTIYQLLDDFKNNGGVILGNGKYATVLTHPNWKHVIKIFSDDTPYLKFVRFVLNNPRQSYPIFYDKPRRIIPNYKRHKTNIYLYVVRTEKLLPIDIREYDNMHYYTSYDKEHAREMMEREKEYRGSTWTFIHNKLIKLETDFPWFPQFKEDYNFLMRNAYDFGSPDITSKNIMKRSSGEFVLSDPFWAGENPYQTYDRLLKAEIGYDDYEYRDENGEISPEKDMVKGGEKFKKPNPVKKITPRPPTSGEEDVPF